MNQSSSLVFIKGLRISLIILTNISFNLIFLRPDVNYFSAHSALRANI